LHNNVGWTLHDQGDFTAALTHFERALECRREETKPEDIRIARWCIARCLRSLGKCEEALREQQSLLYEREASGEKPDGFIHEEIAECLFGLGRFEEARAHFATAHRILSLDPWLVESQPQRFARLAELGGVT
jgi:tetratricopeptide (TPR) repeat protein